MQRCIIMRNNKILRSGFVYNGTITLNQIQRSLISELYDSDLIL
jgi:hypothetical protein